jgi:hypothetical protein
VCKIKLKKKKTPFSSSSSTIRSKEQEVFQPECSRGSKSAGLLEFASDYSYPFAVSV